MTLTRRPNEIDGKAEPNDWEIIYEGCVIGRIRYCHIRLAWFWGIRSRLVDHGDGDAKSYDGARAEFQREWDALSEPGKALAKRTNWWEPG